MSSSNSPKSTKRSDSIRKVFIIGAGPSGLVALKEMLEAGLEPICVDAKKTIGGVFSISYEELYTTTTNMFLAFSDFPPKESLKYWSKEEYLQYLEDYVDHFGLRRYIKLNTAVKQCDLDENTGQWKIRTETWASTPGEMRGGSNEYTDSDKRASLNFKQNVEPGYTYDADYLIVASGTNQVPKYPDFPNCNPEVDVVHSADFTNSKSLCKGKKVLVIGSGESASDIAAQSTDVAEKVTLFSRRNFSLGPRFISKFLTDGAYDERQMLLCQDQHTLKPHDMLEGITNSRVLSKLPLAMFSILFNAMLSDVTSAHGEDSSAGILAKIGKKNLRQDFYALDTSAPTKSGGVLAHAVACQGLDVIVSPEIKFIGDGKIARFKDVSFLGKSEKNVDKVDIDVDIIILCTGFKLDFNWINIEGGKDPIEANPRKWFKHCFPPGLGEKVAFLGYARPAQGGIPQCSELLARYVALLATGERKLPKGYDIQAVNEGQLEKETFYATPNADALVEFAPFASSVARLIKCEPSIPRSMPRFIKFWTLPQWACFYRLNGPGANPDACWTVVDKYRAVDTLVPMPIFVAYILYGAVMQPLMILEYLFGSILIDRSCSRDLGGKLPRWYRWRVGGHFFQLSGNALRWEDLVLPSSGWLLLEMLVRATYLNVVVVISICVVAALLVSFRRIQHLFSPNDVYTELGREEEVLKKDVDATGHDSYGSIV